MMDAMVEYTFSDEQLDTIHDMLEVTPWVSDPYRWYMGLPVGAEVSVSEVEDFAIAFYTGYNARYGWTY